MKNIIFYQDISSTDSGFACLSIISKHYKKLHSISKLKKSPVKFTSPLSFVPLINLAENIGLRAIKLNLSLELLKNKSALPLIAILGNERFVVIYKIEKNKVYISDPLKGKVVLSIDALQKESGSFEEMPQVLTLKAGIQFNNKDSEENSKKTNFSYLFNYLRSYKKFIGQLFIGMLAGTLINLMFPFITQSIVDIGIENNDLNFIYLVLIGQFVLHVSSISFGFIRRWITLYMSSKINIEMVSDFFIKLMKLPLSYFHNRGQGDILQRLGDQGRIESFVTNSAIGFIYSAFNFIFFSIVLAYYNYKILGVFLLGTVLYIMWVAVFMERRKQLDERRFKVMSKNQSVVIELINSIQEIKLYNCETNKRWNWERIQAKSVEIGISSLKLQQSQEAGSSFVVQVTNVFIMLFAATAVIDGDISIGMMIAVLFITGQLILPVNEFIGFINAYQDAKLSIKRVESVHNEKNEESDNTNITSAIPTDVPIILKNIDFKYDKDQETYTLKNISATIPPGKVTAVVGESGSGKSTLLKLLLNFYQPNDGEIMLGDINLNYFNNGFWRSKCAAVLQDGFIFSDTIAGNIALGQEEVDLLKLIKSCKLANIEEFINTLPDGFETVIGNEGLKLSLGQRQRILIARAIYKNPDFLFFDEATNSLDSINERIITNNLEEFFSGRTVVVVAHRLSTVRNADQILVIDKGGIAERGTHDELIAKKGAYFNLFKNQFETV